MTTGQTNRYFLALEGSVPRLASRIAEVCRSGPDVEARVVREYGSVFAAANGAVPPDRIVFANEAEVAAFQASVETAAETIGGRLIELQAAAMAALTSAVAEANAAMLSITPRGPGSARRSYDETVALWLSRVHPALEYWVAAGKLSPGDADRIRSLSPSDQIPEVLRLENKGIYFAKDLSRSIMYSVAPPGTSQHLSMLALDVAEYGDSRVREILARHGWFQTVVSDLPHFTYLGVRESELTQQGLNQITAGAQKFWVPDIRSG